MAAKYFTLVAVLVLSVGMNAQQTDKGGSVVLQEINQVVVNDDGSGALQLTPPNYTGNNTFAWPPGTCLMMCDPPPPPPDENTIPFQSSAASQTQSINGAGGRVGGGSASLGAVWSAISQIPLFSTFLPNGQVSSGTPASAGIAIAGGAALGGLSSAGIFTAARSAWLLYGPGILTTLACGDLCPGMGGAAAFSEEAENSSVLGPTGLRFTERMSRTDFRDLVGDIAKNGLADKVVKYVEIGGEKYVLYGNNRLSAARQLGIANQLIFERVALPYNKAFQTESDVINAAADVLGR